MTPAVSIVIPLYNEEACVPQLLDRLTSFRTQFVRTTEVILVDDGSTDRTSDLVTATIANRPGFTLVTLRTNAGQTAALAAGLEYARGDIIVFMDGDLQNDPADIPRMVDRLDEGFDLVSGWRRDRKDRALTRRFPSWLANMLIARVTGVALHDFGCTLKAYRARVVKSLQLYSDMHRFLPALSARAGARITEMVVTHHPRTAGVSKYGLSRVLKVAVDLVVIQMIVKFSSHPMHYFGRGSLLFLLLTAATGGLWIWNLGAKYHERIVVLPAITVLFFVTFLYFLFLGLLAELIHRVGRTDPADFARAVVEPV